MMMEQRIRYLLSAAHRADVEGDARTARSFRRMAEEARELEVARRERKPDIAPLERPLLDCCAD